MQDDDLFDAPPTLLPVLFGTTSDPDVGTGAEIVLRHLTRSETQHHLCADALTGSPEALRVCIDAGYLPGEDHERALFLFLTSQWERYAALDFDGHLLAGAYEVVDAATQDRIRQAASRSGRADVLRFVLGGDRYSRVRALSGTEATFLIEQLAAAGDHAGLWKLALEMPVMWCFSAVYKLREASWIPESSADRALYHRLLSASDKQLSTQLDALGAALPIALRQASIRFNGRINSLAFGNERPLLVIGSNRRRVGVWDLQTGQMNSVCTTLSRSIGTVEVLEDGRIIAAERTNTPYNDCRLYLIDGDQATVIGTRKGSFTGVQALSGSQFATAGRDRAVTLWDANSRSVIASQQLVDWPRSLHADESGHRLIAVHRGVAIIDSLVQSVSFDSWLPGHVPSVAGIGPGTDDIVIGFHTGPARVFAAASAGSLKERARLDDHHSAVTDIRSDVKRGHVFVSHADGSIAVYAWPTRTRVSVIHTGAPVTSLSLARSGDFLATGHAWDRATIWDLRTSSIPSLFTRPMISTTPSDLGAVVAFSANVELPPGPRQLLDLMAAILRHRFRHDVELDDIVRVKAGRYDIAID